ncbi:heterokaryon incompatibility protein-domain-containing protein [Bisporella sp. PMI_857]|nr:heterokaryon incompatibility protein-domain-containing protein [Bisporella sp. PMI_857]
MDQSCYKSRPLSAPNHIRLLTISSPAGENAMTSCTLTSFHLDEAPPYIALSYTWGAANDRVNISLDPGNTTLSVTKNCHSALLRLQTCYLKPENTARHFWIDSISIDQSNIDERNAQVAVMADIYHTASRVVIDIGELEDSEEADLALNWITWLPESQDDDELYVLAFDLGSRVRDSVRSVYERPWFKRMWILQEAFMAEDAEVMCGTRIEKWKHFRLKRFLLDTHSGFGKILVHLPAPTPNYPAPFVMVQGSRSSRTYTAKKDFLTLLCHSRICSAGDLRDKVFALYNLLSDVAQHGFRADYSNSVTKAAVYTKTTEWLINNSGLSVLSCVRCDPNKRDPTLPSWVPDWADSSVRPEWYISIPIRAEFITDVDAQFWPILAAGNTMPRVSTDTTSAGSPQLIIRGLLVDRIEQTGNILERQKCEISQLAAKNRAKSGLPKITYTWYHTSNMRNKPSWMREYGLPAILNCTGTDEDLAGVFHNTVIQRTLAVTESGYLGPVPEGTQQGDCICILLGAGVPFILRPEGDYWRLIGESYFYGLMKGEALSGKDLSCAEGKVAQNPFVDFIIR